MSTALAAVPTWQGQSVRRGLHREAVEILGRRIASGELAEGERLPNEDELGSELQVSRSVVREAVKVLAAKGLVVARPRTGTRVRPRSEWDVIDHDVLDWILAAGPSRELYADLFEVRSIIEPRAAALAASRRTHAEARALEALLRRMDEAGDDRATYIEADLRLHAAIVKAAHNELLDRLSGILGRAMQAGRDLTTRIPSGPSGSMPLHRAVIHAIVAGDGAAAMSAMQTLIAEATQDMEVVLAGVMRAPSA